MINAFERLPTELLGIADEFAGSDADQHSEAAKRRAKPVSRPRRDAGDVPVAFDDLIPFEFIEGHDRLGAIIPVMPQTSPSVLVIRLDAIGDALALTPLLAALRQRAIPVDLVLRAVNAEIFSSRAARRVYIVPFALRSSTPENRQSIAEFGARLRASDYADVLVATEDPGGYRLARAVEAPARVGFVNGWGKPFKTLWARSMLTRAVVRSVGLDPQAPHECEVLWKLGAALLGDGPIPPGPTLLRPLILYCEVVRSDYIAFQVSDSRHCLRAGCQRAASHRADCTGSRDCRRTRRRLRATRRRCQRRAGRTLHLACTMERIDRRRRVSCRTGQRCRSRCGNGWNADCRRLSTDSQSKPANCALGAVGCALSHRCSPNRVGPNAPRPALPTCCAGKVRFRRLAGRPRRRVQL